MTATVCPFCLLSPHLMVTQKHSAWPDSAQYTHRSRPTTLYSVLMRWSQLGQGLTDNMCSIILHNEQHTWHKSNNARRSAGVYRSIGDWLHKGKYTSNTDAVKSSYPKRFGGVTVEGDVAARVKENERRDWR